MNPQFDFSPTSLSYIGALRNLRPRKPGEKFAYALAECREPELLVCLAASNPEGRFYGLVAGDAEKIAAEKLALARRIDNVTFLKGRPGDFVRAAEAGTSLLPPLHYLCCDERAATLPQTERAALFELAEQLLLPGGLLSIRYRAYADKDEPLRFLVQEFAAEMDAAQAEEFLGELKQLGALYFADHAEAEARLDEAIKNHQPDRYFSLSNDHPARSGAFDVAVALRPRGFAYVGDANIAMNYVELAAPVSAQSLIVKCRDNPLYEPIKDFALNRLERSDIWCRQPALSSDNLVNLFGGFTYGIMGPRAEVPAEIETHGQPIDLTTPLFVKLIDLMTLMPAGIGDFLAHSDGHGFAPLDVVGAIQVLVACGVAKPMRGNYAGEGKADLAQPRLQGSYNQYLDRTYVTAADVFMASPVVGSVIAIPPREALVMQALNRAGLADSVSALLPELQRLAKNPIASARIMDSADPTPESAQGMIQDIVAQSIVQWYAYGLMAGAA
jgi:hypothetical protein